MGDSAGPAYRVSRPLGQFHAWRERGALYVDGLRTSFTAAAVMAGVAKGADFLSLTPAVWLGIFTFLGLESAKVGLGWLDYRLHVYAEHQRIVTEQNRVTMRQVEALERLAPGPEHIHKLR